MNQNYINLTTVFLHQEWKNVYTFKSWFSVIAGIKIKNFPLRVFFIPHRTVLKTSSWYNKNVTLYISVFSFYVQLLCWLIVIWWWWLISLKVLSCVPIQIKQTNISIFSPIFGISLLCRPIFICYVLQLRLIKKMQWQTWPFSFD